MEITYESMCAQQCMVVFHSDGGGEIRYGHSGVGGPFPDMAIAGIAIDRAHQGNLSCPSAS